MYNPTRFEKNKLARKQYEVHTCKNCFVKFSTVPNSSLLFCSDNCKEEYNELGAYEQVDMLAYEDANMYFPE